MKVRVVCTDRGTHKSTNLAYVTPDDLDWFDVCRVPGAADAPGDPQGVRQGWINVGAHNLARDEAGRRGMLRWVHDKQVGVGVFTCPRCPRPALMTETTLRRLVALRGPSLEGWTVDISEWLVNGTAYLDRLTERAANTPVEAQEW